MTDEKSTVGDVFAAAPEEITEIEHDVVCVLVQGKDGKVSSFMTGGKYDEIGNMLAKAHQSLIQNTQARGGKKLRLVE